MPTRLERARAVVDAFVPQDKPGSHYVYAYLGRASYDATQYEIIDGLCLASKRIWHLDESQTDCVAYIGEGVNGRIDGRQRHPFVPKSIGCRIKLYEGLSKGDAQELERLLISELGCLLDNNRPDGCLANIRYFHCGPYCCRQLEAFSYKKVANGIANGGNAAATAAAAVACSVETFAMTADKTITATGSMSELARQFGMSVANISRCCAGKVSGVWSKGRGEAIYFCKADEYHTYTITPMTRLQNTQSRIMIAAKLDGSDICAGTAVEIRTYAPEIKNTGDLHRVARGERPSAYGWTCRYESESDAPVAECGPNLSAFF